MSATSGGRDVEEGELETVTGSDSPGIYIENETITGKTRLVTTVTPRLLVEIDLAMHWM